jgi:hypothetical protein
MKLLERRVQESHEHRAGKLSGSRRLDLPYGTVQTGKGRGRKWLGIAPRGCYAHQQSPSEEKDLMAPQVRPAQG